MLTSTEAPMGKRQLNTVGDRVVMGEKFRFWSSVFRTESWLPDFQLV